MAQSAFVTGGTGFIGINLIERLVNQGWNVTALHRATSDLTYLKRFPIELAEGTITDKDSLERSIPERTDVVFHVAGDTNFWSKRNAQQNAINIDGTRNMVDVAAAKRVGTFIHTSSVSAWGRVKGLVTEETPLEGRNSWINYERTKHLGELEALKGVEKGMKVVVLNPAAWQALTTRTPGVSCSSCCETMHSLLHRRERRHFARARHRRCAYRRRHERSKRRALHLGERRCRVGRSDRRGRARLRDRKSTEESAAVCHQGIGRLSVMLRHHGQGAGRDPRCGTSQGTSFSSEKAIRELGYRIQPMEVAVKDNYDWLVKEGLLGQSG